MSVFDDAHAFVQRWEGGFCNDRNDPGGATKYGVSLRFLRAEGYDIDGDGDIDIDDVKAVTPEDAKRIFKRHFWPLQFEILSDTRPKMAFAAYDAAVNMGLKWSIKFIQKAVGTVPDGIIGCKTWMAIERMSDGVGVAGMLAHRKRRYEYLIEQNAKLSVFKNGWMNRVNDLAKVLSK